VCVTRVFLHSGSFVMAVVRRQHLFARCGGSHLLWCSYYQGHVVLRPLLLLYKPDNCLQQFIAYWQGRIGVGSNIRLRVTLNCFEDVIHVVN
jgi:hypothetical protein